MIWFTHEQTDKLGTLGFGILIALGIVPCVWLDLNFGPEDGPKMTYLGLVFLVIGGGYALFTALQIRARSAWATTAIGEAEKVWRTGGDTSFAVKLVAKRSVRVSVDTAVICAFTERTQGSSSFSDGGFAHEARWTVADGRQVAAGESLILPVTVTLPSDARVSSQRTRDDQPGVRVSNMWRIETRIKVPGLPRLMIRHPIRVERPGFVDDSM